MKKLLFAVMAVALITGAAFANEEARSEIRLKAGVQIAQDYKADGQDAVDLKNGLSAGVEILFPMHEIVKFGLGGEYQFDRGVDKEGVSSEIKHSQIPVYLTAHIAPFEMLKGFYFKANAGWTFYKVKGMPSGDENANGFLWGAGAGYEIKNFFAEAVYSMYYPKFEDDIKLTNKAIGINAGFRFRI